MASQHHVVVQQPALESHTPRSRILELPPELLGHIFELVYHHKGPHELPYDPLHPLEILSHQRAVANRPLCRALYHHQQRQLYRHIEVTSISMLALLARTLVESEHKPRLGTYVARLSLGEAGTWVSPAITQRKQAEALQRGRPYYLVPVGEAAEHLARLLGALGRLEYFRVWFDPGDQDDDQDVDKLALMRLIFEDPSTADHLSSVKTVCLEMHGPTLDAAVPGNAGAWLAQVSRLRHLETLEIGMSVQSLPSILSVPSAALPVLEKLRTLQVYAAFRTWRVPLCSFAPNLTCLKIESEAWWTGSFEPGALRIIVQDAPPFLVELAVMVSSDASSLGPPDAIDDLFKSLPRLRSLRLDVPCYDVERLPSSLAPLANLEVLHLGHLAVPSDRALLRLVTGSARIKSLRTLTLDYVEASFGLTLSDMDDEPPPDNQRDASGLWPGWAAPQWPEHCSWAGLVNVVRHARVHGISVGGSAVCALEWYGAYAAERDAVARRRGFKKGDWGDARRFLGARIVELLEEEQQAASGWPEGTVIERL
ncbi:hypothetical protein JCM8208_005727 [Rhodotorula glutinis]